MSSSASNSVSTNTTGAIQYVPDGDDVLTLVHGQVDAARIAFCFFELRDGERRLDSGGPLPKSGLLYGAHLTLSEPGGLSFRDDSIAPVVLAGEDLGLLEDMDCEQALEVATWVGRPSTAAGQAGAPGAAGAAGSPSVAEPRPTLRAMELPAISAGTLVLGRHYVMVVAGCMGGPGVEDDGLHCGGVVGRTQSTLRPLLAPMSRATREGHVSLQSMHASAATAAVDLRSEPGSSSGATPTLLAFDLGYGFVKPTEPLQEHSVAELGLDESASAQVWRGGSSQFDMRWSDIKSQSLGRVGSVEDGESYLLLFLGPSLGTTSAVGFNPTTLAIVPTGAGRSE